MRDQSTLVVLGAIGSVFAAVAAIISAVISGYFASRSASRSSETQFKIAQINSDKELAIQKEKFRLEQKDRAICLVLEKLVDVHTAVSRLALAYSHTQNHIYWTDQIDRGKFRVAYQEDCGLLHKAASVVDVHLANYEHQQEDIRKGLWSMYGHMNVFWGHQEELLRNDEIEDINGKEAHQRANLAAIVEASDKIGGYASSIRNRLVEIAAIVQKGRGA